MNSCLTRRLDSCYHEAAIKRAEPEIPDGSPAGRKGKDMNTEKLVKALVKAGLTEYKAVNIYNGDDARLGILVLHDYEGPYPTSESRKKHWAAGAIAEKHGLRYEPRGHYTATLIYC